MPAPSGCAEIGVGDAVLHFDLHPLNVLMSPQGPVIIDWTNACRGPAAADVAQTWIIMATSEADVPSFLRPLLGRLRSWFLDRFLASQDREAACAQLPAIAEHRKRDRNVLPSEIVEIDRLLAREGVA